MIVAFEGIRHRGRRVVKWIARTEEVLGAEAAKSDVYPELVFELFPDYGPTWNLYGPIFSAFHQKAPVWGTYSPRCVCGTAAAALATSRQYQVNRLLVRM